MNLATVTMMESPESWLGGRPLYHGLESTRPHVEPERLPALLRAAKTQSAAHRNACRHWTSDRRGNRIALARRQARHRTSASSNASRWARRSRRFAAAAYVRNVKFTCGMADRARDVAGVVAERCPKAGIRASKPVRRHRTRSGRSRARQVLHGEGRSTSRTPASVFDARTWSTTPGRPVYAADLEG